MPRWRGWGRLEQLGPAARAGEARPPAPAPKPKQRHVQPGELDGIASPDYAAWWGGWLGREVEFYRACAEHVATLSWPDVLAISGAVGTSAARVVRARYADLMNHDLPPRLTVGSFTILGLGQETCRIMAYSETDPVELPSAVLDVLPSFDGRLVGDVLADLEARDIEVEPAFVRRLVDLGVLVAS